MMNSDHSGLMLSDEHNYCEVLGGIPVRDIKPLDFGSELVEIKGELDCETEIVDNVAVSGTINIQ